MGIETVYTCPLGSTCKEIVDGKIHQCSWYVKLQGDDPQTGEKVDEYRCSMAWQPILAVAQNASIIQTSASVQSLRNETAIRQDRAIKVLKDAESS